MLLGNSNLGKPDLKLMLVSHIYQIRHLKIATFLNIVKALNLVTKPNHKTLLKATLSLNPVPLF